MSYGIFVKSTKDGKFIDFVATNKASKHVRRVSMTEINARKRTVRKVEAEIMDISLRLALLGLDYHYRHKDPIHRDWKLVAKKNEGYSAIGA